MDRLFRIDFYPQDWILDTARLNPEQRGIYIQIVSLMYAGRGAIDNNPTWIAGVSGCSARLVKKVLAELAQLEFVTICGSKITQKRVEDELNKKREHLEASAKGGRKAAEKNAIDNDNNNLAVSEVIEPLHSSIAIATASPKATASNPPVSPPMFEEFYSGFPAQRRGGRKTALAAWKAAIERGADPQEILAGMYRYQKSDEVAKKYAKGTAAWLNDDRWLNDYSPPKSDRKKTAFEENMDAARELIGGRG